MGLSKLWGKDSSGNRGFVFSHIKTIYYNWAQKKLLSTKLDEMDSATNGKIDKTSIVQVESTSQTNVPSSAYLKTVKDALDGDISELNAKKQNSLELPEGTNIDDQTVQGGFVNEQDGYYTMHMGWITLQLKLVNTAGLFYRWKYGQSVWSQWYKFN